MDEGMMIAVAEPSGGFVLPEGFTVPEGTKEGGTFEALVSLTLGPGGTARPSAVDGIPIQEPEKEQPEEEMEAGTPFADRVANKIQQIDPNQPQTEDY